VCSSALIAQETNAVVTGNVLDATGSQVPDAVITATNVNTGVMASQKSNASGVYTFLTLQPGEYRFTAEKTGFRKLTVEHIMLRTGDRMTQNLSLQVGAISEEVQVTADAEAINYLNTTQSSLITTRRIGELPTFGRNVMDFVSTTPGLVTTGSGVNVNGSRTDALNATLDGINILDNYINETIQNVEISLSTDRIEELRVVTSPVDAEFGRGSAQVMAVSRAGTNKLHGAVYNYLRNDALNANSWANNRSAVPKTIIRENNSGARLDGPIKRNKIFFFGLFESDITRSQRTTTATTLTDLARKGIFRFYPGVQNNNALGANPVVDSAGNPITPRNATGALQSISLFGLDPNRLVADTTGNVAKNLALLPSPNTFNTGDGLNTAGYQFVQPFPSDTYSLNARIDDNISDKHRLFISYARDANRQPNGVNTAPLPTSLGGLYDQYGMVASTGVISTLRPNLVNEFRAGVTRTTIDFLPPWANDKSILPSIGNQPYLLSLGNGLTNPYSTATSADPQARLAPVYQIGNKVSWLHGIHNIKAGYDVRFVSVHEYLSFNVVPRVTLGVGNVGTQNILTIPGIGQNGTAAGNLLATLSGTVASVTQLFYAPPGKNPQFVPGAYNSHNYRQREMDGFVQDDLRLTRNLTLNLGMRWEYYGVPYEANGRLVGLVGGSGNIFGISGNNFGALFNPGVMPGSLTQVQLIGRNSANPDVQPWSAKYRNFAPVVGLAWNLPWEKWGFNKTVVRAGYSISYERLPLVVLDNVNGSSQPGLSQNVSISPSNFVNLNGVSLPLQPTQSPLQTVPINDTNNSPVTIYGASDLKTPYIQNWNLSVGRSITKSVVLDIRYVGSKGTRLYRGTNIDEINIFENGILDAFRTTDAGGSAALFNQIFKGLNVPGVGVVDGSTITGSDAVRRNTTLNAFLLANNPGGLAQFLAYNTFITGTRGGLLKNGGLPANFVDANPQFGVARLVGNYGNSTYHSLQVEVNKRFSRGLQIQASYVRSKTLGDYDGNGQDLTSNYQTIRSLRLDKHPLGFDFPNIWRTNGIWEMPFGPHRKLLGNSKGFVAHLVEKWQTSVIFNKLSGAPTTFTDNAGGTFNNQVTATPALLTALPNGDVHVSGNNVLYFNGLTQVADPSILNLPASLRANAALFALAGPDGKIIMQNPALGTLGGGYVMFRGPGSFTLNAQLSKLITIRENLTIRLRADAVNLLNKPIWNAPNTTAMNIDSVNFGVVTGAAGTRNVQLGARIEF
jgi:hypothetical protein